VTIGYIGYGAVGRAYHWALSMHSALINDPSMGKSASYREMADKCRFIVVAVPTPSHDETRAFDPTIINGVIAGLHESKGKRHPIIIVKSAVLPTTVKEWQSLYANPRLVISPEYLTNRDEPPMFCGKVDWHIFGCCSDDVYLDCRHLIEQSRFKQPARYACVSQVGAALLKYMENSIFALKVTFMNEYYDLASALGLRDEWPPLMEAFHLDRRVGTEHYEVPGPDGKRGWGGKCFPKDINAIIGMAKGMGMELQLLDLARELNYRWRDDVDLRFRRIGR
jgi:UDPglucose 6-dehydrogenase